MPEKANLEGSFSISGAYALSPMLKEWREGFIKLHPGVTINISETGTGQGLADLTDGKVNLAMISRPLTDAEKESGVWVIPVARDGIAPIVNQKNPYIRRLMHQGLSPDELQKLFTSDKPVRWGELLDSSGSGHAVVYTRAVGSGAADVFSEFLFRKSTDLKGIQVAGDEEMIKSVQNNIMAVGFCNFSFAFSVPEGGKRENIQIVPFDLDYDNLIGRKEEPFKDLDNAHRSVWLGIYPERLCRELTVGSVGQPSDPLIKEFLKYIITEGQEMVKESGLCELNSVHLRSALESLE